MTKSQMLFLSKLLIEVKTRNWFSKYHHQVVLILITLEYAVLGLLMIRACLKFIVFKKAGNRVLNLCGLKT
jgi:hypothetical protein